MEGGHSLLERLLHDKNAEPTDMPISLLKSITDNFADALKIGCGGFAVVYKGVLKNGAIVAVKKLSNSICMDENKYNQEVSCLMRVKHRNVVRFLGYCADTQGKMLDYGGKFVMADVRERLLCFEYVPNGTLKDYITDASNGLEWRKCYQIIKGISEGLHYLHGLRIVHLDLKPANILLDDNMVPKIADFGISRCFDQEQSWAIATKLVGTPGYLAPESYTRKITTKLDLYSLGVIIIEILTGQKGYSSVENVLESWRNRLKTSSAIDTVLEQIRVCFEISIVCMDFNPEKRPTTQRIIELLEQTERMDQFNETEVQAPGASSKAWQLQPEIARRQLAEDIRQARVLTDNAHLEDSRCMLLEAHAEVIRQARVLADDAQLEDARCKLLEAQEVWENIAVDEGEKIVISLRDELQQLIMLMDTKETYEAQGRAYALASETFHGRQRYAAQMKTSFYMDLWREQAKNFEKDPMAAAPSAADEDVKQD